MILPLLRTVEGIGTMIPKGRSSAYVTMIEADDSVMLVYYFLFECT